MVRSPEAHRARRRRRAWRRPQPPRPDPLAPSARAGTAPAKGSPAGASSAVGIRRDRSGLVSDPSGSRSWAGMQRLHVPAPVVVAVSWLAGTLPVSNLAAKRVSGVDLRDVGGGTVSGSGLYQVGGFRPLVVAGCFELVKGAIGPLLAGERAGVGALAAGAAIVGHDWSPWLGGAGGRGISLAMGAGLVAGPEATALLAAGLAIGKASHQAGLASAIALAAIVPALGLRHGTRGALLGTALVVPITAKRLAGNRRPPAGWSWSTLGHRLLFDTDPPTHAPCSAGETERCG